jgi:2-iminobutanoate/2-iminopropanoate deaminase
MRFERLQVAGAPTPAGPYSHAVAANGFLFTAGFGPNDPTTGQLVGDEIEEQTRQVLRNVGTVLAAAGLGFGDVVKSTVHLADLHRDFEGFNRAYAEFFTQGYPVRTTVGSTLANILVEIDVVAALREPTE